MADETAPKSLKQEIRAVQESPTPLIQESAALEPLYQWIADRRLEDCCPAQIFSAIVEADWGREAAAMALQHVLGDALEQREIDAMLRGCPWPDMSSSPSSITVEGHEVQVLLEMQRSRVMLFGSLLTDDECDELVEIARPRMNRSTYNVDGVEKKGEHLGDARSSYSTDISRSEDIPLLNRIDMRVQGLLNWPIDFAGGWQVLRYDVGGQFKPHHDCFKLDVGSWHPWLRQGGHRCGTLLIYLKTPGRGGGTSFPDVPMEVTGHKGSAVYFGYPRPDGFGRTLHAGAPVIEGEKWAMVKWFRQGPYRA